MGVFIKAVKPLDLLIETEKNNINFERLNNAEETIDNDTIIVFSLDFTPLEHLTKFKYGLYVEGEHGYWKDKSEYDRQRRVTTDAYDGSIILPKWVN